MKKIMHLCKDPFAQALIFLSAILTSILYKKPDYLISTYDAKFHVFRLMSSIGALNDGQIVPQFDPYRVRGFGNAANLFYGPLTSWLMVPIYFLTRNTFISIIILMFIITLVTSIVIYTVGLRIFKSRNISFIVAIVYMLEPYHLSQMTMRMNPGEYLTFTFIPLIFLSFYEIVYESKISIRQLLLLSLGVSGLILNHILTTVIIGALFLFIAIFECKKIASKKVIILVVQALILAVGVSAVYIFPFIEVKNLNIYSIFWDQFKMSNPAIMSRISPSSLFLTRTNFPLRITWMLWAVVFIYILIRKEIKNKKVKDFSFILIFLSIMIPLLGTNLSILNFFEKYIKVLQFTDRLILIPAVSLPIVMGLIITMNKKMVDKNFFIILAFILAFYGWTITLTTQDRILGEPYNVNRDFNEQNITSPIAMGEYLPRMIANEGNISIEKGIESSVRNIENRGDDLRIIQGNIIIKNYSKNGSKINLDVEKTDGDTIIEFPIIYYPGFKANLESQKVKTTFSKNGFLQVELKKNQIGNLKIKYGLSKLSFIGLIISIISVVVITILFFYSIMSKSQNKGNKTAVSY
ncbi:hypothetical protein [Floricoccus penangensis]|uniref:hypothetical protein n=1 Tax=Floricoccus penangensis TaxID=1859475 RepID=UPI00203AB37C|nr:hypothetical protein [Floricoccus penangensis]URZ87775.1 hypothetical protein KIW23_01630 [Floricoccus penangensis]